MVNKLIIVGVLLVSVLSGLYWANEMIEENALLEKERNEAVESNADIVSDNNYLLNEIRTRDADILARDEFITELSIATNVIKEELDDAKKQLSVEELTCLESDIPDAYRDKLQQRSRKGGDEDGDNLPVSGVLPEISVF